MFPAPFCFARTDDPDPQDRVTAKWAPVFGQDHPQKLRATTID
jgi:hypothetical protein